MLLTNDRLDSKEVFVSHLRGDMFQIHATDEYRSFGLRITEPTMADYMLDLADEQTLLLLEIDESDNLIFSPVAVVAEVPDAS